MNLAVEALTAFAVVITRLHRMPLSWTIGTTVICLAAWALVITEMRREQPPQEERRVDSGKRGRAA